MPFQEWAKKWAKKWANSFLESEREKSKMNRVPVLRGVMNQVLVEDHRPVELLSES